MERQCSLLEGKHTMWMISKDIFPISRQVVLLQVRVHISRLSSQITDPAHSLTFNILHNTKVRFKGVYMSVRDMNRLPTKGERVEDIRRRVILRKVPPEGEAPEPKARTASLCGCFVDIANPNEVRENDWPEGRIRALER